MLSALPFHLSLSLNVLPLLTLSSSLPLSPSNLQGRNTMQPPSELAVVYLSSHKLKVLLFTKSHLFAVTLSSALAALSLFCQLITDLICHWKYINLIYSHAATQQQVVFFSCLSLPFSCCISPSQALNSLVRVLGVTRGRLRFLCSN